MAFRFKLDAFVFVCLGSGFVAAGCGKQLGDELGDELGAGTQTDGGESTTDESGESETGETGADGPFADMTGTYLFALELSLGPDLPLQSVLEIDNVIVTGDGATADFTFHTLSLEQGGIIPGECIGVPLEYDGVPFDADGNFTLDMGLVPLLDNPDPNGLPNLAEITLHGHLVQPDAMCGEAEGMLMSPLEYDLAGSTFAAIPLAAGCDADPFPAPAYKCSML